MAVGMVNAAKAAGKKADDLILVGYDGILDAVNMTMDGDLDAFVSLPNLDEGAMGVKLATALVMNSDYHYDREILYDCTLVTGEFVDGLTDQTIYEYAAEQFRSEVLPKRDIKIRELPGRTAPGTERIGEVKYGTFQTYIGV
ncbi:MAG: hypothetical protein ACLTW9_30375 [Enterocloster sp.]